MYPAEKELVKGLNKSCQKTFEAIYQQYWEILYQAAYNRLRDQEAVEDVVQEIFMDLWNRRRQVQIKSNLKAYLLTAVKYQVIKKMDAERIKREQEVTDVEVAYFQQDILEFEDLYQQLEMAIDKLPAKSRLIFTMSRMEGLSTEEIADKLQLSPQTIHNRMHQSLTLLRSELKEYAPAIALIFLN